MLIKDQPQYFIDILWARLLSSSTCNSRSTNMHVRAQNQTLPFQLSAKSEQLQTNFFPNQSKTNKKPTEQTNTQEDSTWYSPILSIRLRTNPHVFWLLIYDLATHSSVLAWRIPGMGEPGGQPSMGLHRVGHD